VDWCSEREYREITFCKEKYADWHPELYRMCLERAKNARKHALMDYLIQVFSIR
jgi:hypothetical protein